MYGGEMLDGEVFGDVWVLSLPFFQWIRVANPKVPDTLVTGHECLNLNDRYLIVYGGRDSVSDFWEPATCNDYAYNHIRLFDLSSLEWTTRYETDQAWHYRVPARIQEVIGGRYV